MPQRNNIPNYLSSLEKDLDMQKMPNYNNFVILGDFNSEMFIVTHNFCEMCDLHNLFIYWFVYVYWCIYWRLLILFIDVF